MQKSSSYRERARLRKGRTPEFYRQFLAGFPASGQTVAQYCRKHHVGESTFHKYRRLSKAGGRKTLSGHPAKPTVPRMVRVLPTPPSSSSTHPLEIQLPSGTVLRLTHIDAQILAVLSPVLNGTKG